jgi:ubiquinone biosynthesis monooxygenase Coq7
MYSRHYDAVDRLIVQVDQFISAIRGQNVPVTPGPYPAADIAEQPLVEAERLESERMMRVNHAGEICAQALYHAQALSTGDPAVRAIMEKSAEEEGDHLHWCRQRLLELQGRTSHLDPFWYLGSFAIGTAAGLAGDRFSLGFVAETEHQVGMHLQKHLRSLSARDAKSRAVLQQMAEDEARHGATAMAGGGVALPQVIRTLMQLCSRVMTGTAYWI